MNKIQGKYRVEIVKIDPLDDFYSLRVYELTGDELIMSTVNYLQECFDESVYWLMKK